MTPSPAESCVSRGELDVRDPSLEEFGAERDDVAGSIEVVTGYLRSSERNLAGAAQRFAVERLVQQVPTAVHAAEPFGRQLMESSGRQAAHPGDAVRSTLSYLAQARGEEALRIVPGHLTYRSVRIAQAWHPESIRVMQRLDA